MVETDTSTNIVPFYASDEGAIGRNKFALVMLGTSVSSSWPTGTLQLAALQQKNICYCSQCQGPYMDSSSFANNPSSGREVRLLTYIRSRTAAPAPGAEP